MASHAALASSRIPSSSIKLHHTKTPTRVQRLEFSEFSGLRSVSLASNARESSFSDVVTAQLSTKVRSWTDSDRHQDVNCAPQLRDVTMYLYVCYMMHQVAAAKPIRGETVAKLKVAINGFGRIGRNFLRCWHGRKDSPLDVIVVNDSGGVKNVSSQT